MYGHSMSYGIEGQMGQIQIIQDVARAIATATGIRDPIAHYEPGVPLDQVWAKYDSEVTRYLREILGLRSTTAQGPLMEQMKKCEIIRNRLRAAFAPGTTIGERDRDRLAELVTCVRNWRKEWNDAQKQYGMGPIPGEIMKPFEFAPQTGGTSPILLGLGVLGLLWIAAK
jgi:hypothetical protein